MKHIQRIFFVTILLCSPLQAIKIGSNFSSSRQKSAYFRANDNTNEMLGFTVFEQGVVLQDENASCLFNAFFPIGGGIILNQGTLTLNKDIQFKNPVQFGPGTFAGQSNAIEFPGNVSTLDLPTLNYEKVLTLADQIDIGDNVHSVDWSFDGDYLAMASATTGGLHELQIFYFDGTDLTLTGSYDFGSQDLYAVSWHPSDHRLAVGIRGGTELQLLGFDPLGNTLQVTDSADIGTVYAVAWSPSGNHLAVGVSGSNLLVYPVTSGALGTVINGALGSSRTVQRNALSWNTAGDYIAVGLNRASGAEGRVFHFDGASLTQNASVETNASVTAVSWRPNSTYVLFGMSSGSERFRLYDHDSVGGTLTEFNASRLGETRVVYGLDWNSTGDRVAVARSRDTYGHEVRVYTFDATTKEFALVSGVEFGVNAYTVGWSPNDDYLATGDLSDFVSVYSYAERPMIFDSTKLFFNSDVVVRGEIQFKGDCIVNGESHAIDMGANGSIVIMPGATLTIEQANIKGVSGTNIRCSDNTGTLILSDATWLQDGNMTFANGAIQFSDTVVMGGEYTFAYQSIKTSTVMQKTELIMDDGFTFSYDAQSGAEDLIEFIDDTSVFVLDGGTLHATVTGMELKKGTLKIERDSYVSVETQTITDPITFDTEYFDRGITFGDGTGSNDMHLEILGGVLVSFTGGSLNYRNANTTSIEMGNKNSVLNIGASNRLNLYQNFDLGPGILELENYALIGRTSGVTLTGAVVPLGKYFNISLYS